MKRFTALFSELDRTTRTNEKVAAIERYFAEAPPADAAWALQFLCGRTVPRVVSSRNFWEWTANESNLPSWLIEESYEAVGDMAEACALLLPNHGGGISLTLAELVEQRLLPLGQLPDHARHELLVRTWREFSSGECLVWNKLITGNFRIGVARTLVVRALAKVAGVDPAIMAHRVLGEWRPTAEDFLRLLSPSTDAAPVAKPYPFFLASSLEMKIKRGDPLDELGNIADWLIEWKWDGIRAQLIRRENQTLIWSRGDEMVTESFPEIIEAGNGLPNGTVLDGEILAWRGDAPLPFAMLQRRLGRKTVAAKTRKEYPIVFAAYDLLEADGQDLRDQPLRQRRAQLENVIANISQAPRPITATESTPMFPGFEATSDLSETSPHPVAAVYDRRNSADSPTLRLSPVVEAPSWNALAVLQNEARSRGVEGLMLKQADSPYRVGRQRGDWWKWKIDPFTVDAVLVAAQRGHGRRASLYTDYTFALWQNGQLVPIAKAYSGLTDEEILQVDALVRNNTSGKFGPVRSVKPTEVFELAFEAIQKSTRHKSGVAVRFPRISRWRHDKKPEEADSLEYLLKLATPTTP